MKLHAQYKMSNKKYMVTLSLIKFKEDKAAIIYSPALDLSGYGNTFEDAKKSFSTTLQEFIKYTHNKRTLETCLIKMGWKIKQGKQKVNFVPPKETDLIKKNSLYTDIVNNKEYSVMRQNVEFAL